MRLLILICIVAGLQVFQVWLDRGVLAKKVLEPHLEQLKTHPVIAAPAHEPDDELMQPTKLGEFGCALLLPLPPVGPHLLLAGACHHLSGVDELRQRQRPC